MADEWFYQKNGQKFGPITSLALRQMATDGLLWPMDLVTKAGMTTWVEASKVKGLFTNNAPQAIQAPQITTGPSVNGEQNISNRAPAIPPPINEPIPFTENTVPQVASPIASKPTLGSSIFSGLLQPTKPANVPTNQTPTVSTPAITTPLNPRLPFGLDPNAVILDHPVVYQGGHPALHKKADGRLLLTDNYILFVGESASDDLSFPFDSCKDLFKPAVGSYPQKLIDQANTTKAMADIGKSVAKFAGTWMGGSGGRLVKAAGGAGSDVAKGTTALGAPPKNRLTVVFLDSSKYPHKVLFDISGSSKAEMEKRAEEIWMRISPFRPKFARVENPNQDVRKIGKVPTQSISGTVSSKSSYRILNPGTPVETVTGQELSQRLASGELGPGTLVCLEFWVPIHMAANFGIFGSIGTGGSGRDGQGTQGRNGDAGITGPDPDGVGKVAGKSGKKRGGGAGTAIAAGVAGAVVGAVAGAALSSAMRKKKGGTGSVDVAEEDEAANENEIQDETDDSNQNDEDNNDVHEELNESDGDETPAEEDGDSGDETDDHDEEPIEEDEEEEDTSSDDFDDE